MSALASLAQRDLTHLTQPFLPGHSRREAHFQLGIEQAAPSPPSRPPPSAQNEPAPKPKAVPIPIAAVAPPLPVAKKDSPASSAVSAQPIARARTPPPPTPQPPKLSEARPVASLPIEAGPSKLPVAQTVDVLPVVASVAPMPPSLKGKEREQPMSTAAPALKKTFESVSAEGMVPGYENDSPSETRSLYLAPAPAFSFI